LQTREVLEFLEQLTLLEQRRLKRDSFGNTTVIVFEGLQNSGKSSVMDSLTSGNHGKACSFPTKALPVKEILSSHSQPVLMAFLYICNYFTAAEVMDSAKDSTVVYLSDYFHYANVTSTCNMPLNEQDLQLLPSSAFEWPLDLPSPSLVIFLAVPTEVRLKRGGPRPTPSPCDEQSIANAIIRDAFRQVSLYWLTRNQQLMY
jgi:thymidylate kinase